MKILLCNDDGIHSGGLKALADILAAKNQLLIIAPDGNRSCTSHSLTLFKPVKITESFDFKDCRAYSISGTPADCVKIGFTLFKDFMPDLGFLIIPLAYFVLTGSSNAVNLTDGLDGLAIATTITVAAGLGVIAWLTSNANFAVYLYIPYLPNASELVVACTAIVGAGLGFLWFNTYPAEVFMGDVGSLALGAVLGIIALLCRQEILLFIMGGVFVMETISVILQVGSYKMRGRRIFRMAPIHHHFEKGGWPEPRVFMRFWIVTLVLVLIGLITLKLR